MCLLLLYFLSSARERLFQFQLSGYALKQVSLNASSRVTGASVSVSDPPGQPYIEGYTEGETVQRGQNLELSCRSRGGNPPAEIIWYKNDEKIQTASRIHNSFSENVLSFTVRADDEKARYRCEVFNIMSVQPMKANVQLTVLCKCATRPIIARAVARTRCIERDKTLQIAFRETAL